VRAAHAPVDLRDGVGRSVVPGDLQDAGARIGPRVDPGARVGDGEQQMRLHAARGAGRLFEGARHREILSPTHGVHRDHLHAFALDGGELAAAKAHSVSARAHRQPRNDVAGGEYRGARDA